MNTRNPGRIRAIDAKVCGVGVVRGCFEIINGSAVVPGAKFLDNFLSRKTVPGTFFPV
jgi:hypothetical protein